jgi:hypothetical protein
MIDSLEFRVKEKKKIREIKSKVRESHKKPFRIDSKTIIFIDPKKHDPEERVSQHKAKIEKFRNNHID